MLRRGHVPRAPDYEQPARPPGNGRSNLLPRRSPMTVYVGLDWASAEHAVCRIEASGAVLDRFQATHSAEGLEQLVQRLRKDTRGEPVRIAVERPSGLLIDTLVEAGFEVVPIHPNVVKSSRSRYRTSQAKDDRSDAYLLADLLR